MMDHRSSFRGPWKGRTTSLALAGFIALGLPQGDSPQVAATFEGSVREGLQQMRTLAESGDLEGARAVGEACLRPGSLRRMRHRLDEKSGGWSERILTLGDPVLERLGWNGAPEKSRAEIHYALGLVAAAGGNGDAAATGFSRASELAGTGTLRLEALYNKAGVVLAAAEAQREKIPELQAGLASAAPVVGPQAGQPLAGSAPQAEKPAQDPLELALGLYAGAKQLFVERLRADCQDFDTRANLELIQRRIRELEELREQRQKQEEEQKKQEDQQQEGEDEQQSEDSKSENQQQDGSDQPDEQPGEQPQDQSEEQPEEKQQPEPSESEEQQSDPKEEQGEEEGAQQEEPELQEAEGSGEPRKEERLLTREQVMRLLDQLAKIEEEGQRIRAMLRESRRVAVEKDW